jgi:hypothetical protein
MRYLTELNLKQKDKTIVKKWLQEWIDVFKERADGQEGTVRKQNFKENIIFFFTDCQDLFDKVEKGELTLAEENQLEQKRKQNVYFQLFLKELITGEPVVYKQKCSHCGCEDVDIFGIPPGIGFCTFCPGCNRTSIDTYVPHLDSIIKPLKEILLAKRVDFTMEK